MKNIFTLTLILALGAPAAAELAAPELPFIDAAVVRSQPFEKESINIGAAFPGMQACKFTGVQGDTCSFACKDGSTVKRPRLNSTVAQNGGCPIMVMVPSGAPKAAVRPAIANGLYTNASGCVVEAENGANGTLLAIEYRGERAMLGVLNNFSGGDISAFCRPAAASFSGGVLTLGCQEQNNGGYSTRGTAELDLRGGLSAVRVRGEVKKSLGWKTDTNISCEGLIPATKSAPVEKLSTRPDISGTYSIKNGYAEGSVTVRQFPANNTEYAAFILSTVAGPNAHTAYISGVALQTQSGDFAFRDENNCTLRLKVSNGVLTVTGANATCGGYMGMNAAADGDYKKTAGYLPDELDGHYALETAYTQGDLEARELPAGPDSSLPSLGFALFTVSGPNAHTAYISGVAVRTTTPGQFAFVGEEGCELRLKPENGSIRVSDNGACAAYMGMNAAVAGKYSRTK